MRRMEIDKNKALCFLIVLVFGFETFLCCVPLKPMQSPNKSMFMLILTSSFKNGTFDHENFWMVEQIKYGLDELGEWPWNQMGYVFYDTCDDPQQVVNIVTLFAEILSTQVAGLTNAQKRENIPTLPEGELVVCPCQVTHSRRVVAVVGDFSERLSQILSYILGRVDSSIIIGNRRQSGEALENKDDFPNYFTFVNTNEFKARLIRSLLLYQNWSYVAVLYGDSSIYQEERKAFMKEIAHGEICTVSKQIRLSDDVIEDTLLSLQKDKYLSVFVLLCDDATTFRILKAASLLNMYQKVWIVTGGEVYEKKLRNLPAFITEGIIRISVNAEFGYPLERFLNLSYRDRESNPLLKLFFEYHNVTDENARVRDFQDYFNFNDLGATNVLSIVQKFTEALRRKPLPELIAMIAKNYLIFDAVKSFLIEGKRNGDFDFQSYALWRYNNSRFIRFGDWRSDTNDLIISTPVNWFHGVRQLHSNCDVPCKPGFYSIPYDSAECCRVCLPCRDGTYKNHTGYEECSACENMSISNADGTKCNLFKLQYQRYGEPTSYILYFLAISSISLITFFAITFWRYRSTPVVISSDQRTVVIQLTCMMFLFASVFLFLGHPGDIVCALQVFVPGFLLTVFIGLTLVKTERLLQIFQMLVRVTRKQRQITTTIAISIILTLVSAYVILLIIVFMKWTPNVRERLVRESLVNEVTCNTNVATLFQSAYIALISLICMVEALRARKLPENYSEVKFIFLAMFLLFLLQLVRVPVFMSHENPQSRTFIESTLIILNGLFVTAVLYGYKVFIIIFRPDQNSVDVFRKQVRDANFKVMNRDLVDSTSASSSPCPGSFVSNRIPNR